MLARKPICASLQSRWARSRLLSARCRNFGMTEDLPDLTALTPELLARYGRETLEEVFIDVARDTRVPA